MNYKSLLNPLNTTTEQTLLGQKVFIRRLTSTELDNYTETVTAGRAAGLPDRQLSVMGVNLFLDALVNEDGSRPKKTDLPTADELLDAHASADLLEAVTRVQRHSYGTLEDAEKN
ncbi:phage tail protein [Leclercia adecarboxylata]|uniref:phage tail protein n=1 Tax=Leclercia adecarboxylata TaxID=83655 RepID=UPI001F064A50|nr:phage tail protein [Leclercia adecarboxylata]MCH2683566.1 phage tail protein [Leclercia adecarboxylata]